MTPQLIIAAVLAAAGFAGGFGVAWEWQASNIDQINLERKDEIISQQRTARATIERATNSLVAAQNKATDRAILLRRNDDLSRSALDSLRESSAAAVRAAANDLAACNRIAAAQSAVLNEGGELLQEVSRDADQCFSDLQLTQEAWPK
ncbi:MAG: hypothetical protein PHD99_04755 [Candidatus Moranbacteria bacterium]|nr:hypothetical protein [Candidatus Moranbacteria bacterium]